MKDKLKEFFGKTMLFVFGSKKSISMYYKIKTGNKLDFNNPKRYSEKIQKRKLDNNNPLYILCADKVKGRDFVKEKIGEEYLIPMYFAKKVITIEDLAKLPNSFVLKTNNASKTNIIVSDKKKVDLNNIVKTMNKYVKYKFGYRSYELFYNKIEPLIIAEKYIGKKNGEVPNDYKFHVFNSNGNSKIIIQVDKDRFSNHSRAFFDEDWKRLNYSLGFGNCTAEIKKPKDLKKMIQVAKKLAENFDYVRVDLYYQDDNIYFGELTFTHGSGYEKFTPDKYDIEWGSYWNEK